MESRYIRQETLRCIGLEGQERISSSAVAIVGLGALGSVNAELMTRAGIGMLRLIDGDIVELINLQRQFIYNERDAALQRYKADAAYEYLHSVNSDITIEPIKERLTALNISSLLSGIDLVIDSTDNYESRFLINEYCVHHKLPWIYGGVIGTEGMVSSILPGGPCLVCQTGTSDAAEVDIPCMSTQTAGILGPVTVTVSALQSCEAIKILTGSDAVRRGKQYIDLWGNISLNIPVAADPECPVCKHHRFRYLGSL